LPGSRRCDVTNDPEPLSDEELDALLRRSGEAMESGLNELVDTDAGLAQVERTARRRAARALPSASDDAARVSAGKTRRHAHDEPGGYAGPSGVLAQILDTVRADLAERQRHVSLEQLKDMAYRSPAPLNALAALMTEGVSVIAEVKRASPSRGSIAAADDPAALAREYEASGASMISVTT
jgi:hypothetical protein